MATIYSMDQFASWVNEIGSSAYHAKAPASWVSGKCMAVMDEVRSRTKGGKMRYSVFMIGYVSGLIAAQRDQLWRKTEFVYRDRDGTLYSTAKNSIHRSTEEWYSSGRGSELGTLERAHVWLGTDKPYTEWSL